MKPIKPIAEKDFNYQLGDTMQQTLMKLLSVFVVKINQIVQAVNYLIDNQK